MADKEPNLNYIRPVQKTKWLTTVLAVIFTGFFFLIIMALYF